MIAQEIAVVCHEANRAYCLIHGDNSQPPWSAAPKWQKDSAIAGVQLILSNPYTTPEDSHRAWCNHKRAEGWTYGPDKDPVAKTHPCLVDYDLLPENQRVKDRLFGAIVRALAGAVYVAG